MGIREVLTAPHSPWQNPFAERLIGSIRRECLDHVLVLSERHLRRALTGYFAFYHRSRTHLALQKDTLDERPIERPELRTVVQIPEVGGLHSTIATSAGRRSSIARPVLTAIDAPRTPTLTLSGALSSIQAGRSPQGG